jgi:hypothetical protein
MLRPGVVPSKRGRARDYTRGIQALIVRGCHHFSIRVIAKDPFPSDTVPETWAKECFEAACADVGESYSLDDGILKTVISLNDSFPIWLIVF